MMEASMDRQLKRKRPCLMLRTAGPDMDVKNSAAAPVVMTLPWHKSRGGDLTNADAGLM